MSKAHEAYANSSRMVISDPREFEANLLLKAAARLQKLRDMGDNVRIDESEPHLIYNRKIWTVFAASAAEMDHPLPKPIKQNIASLAVFIFKQTATYQTTGEARLLETLITINREIAAGLYQKAA
ncbi:MAG: flagellar biosynthesis regulator FlaF [Rhizobiales bacterium]|nr:flagellar biosynthesis regulator FlaF [Hyphomicrobiales bacterium]